MSRYDGYQFAITTGMSQTSPPSAHHHHTAWLMSNSLLCNSEPSVVEIGEANLHQQRMCAWRERARAKSSSIRATNHSNQWTGWLFLHTTNHGFWTVLFGAHASAPRKLDLAFRCCKQPRLVDAIQQRTYVRVCSSHTIDGLPRYSRCSCERMQCDSAL